MREQSIHQCLIETQYTDTKEVYCPMCDMEHENSTWCQFPGWEG